MKGKMSVGMLVAFLSYKDQFTGRIGSLINAGFKLRMLSVQTDRLSDIVLTPPETEGHGPPTVVLSTDQKENGASMECRNDTRDCSNWQLADYQS